MRALFFTFSSMLEFWGVHGNVGVGSGRPRIGIMYSGRKRETRRGQHYTYIARTFSGHRIKCRQATLRGLDTGVVHTLV